MVARINESLRPNERIETPRLTVAHLKMFVRLVKEADKATPLVASKSRPGLIADIAAYLDGTLSKRQRKTTRKQRARDDVHVNYETLQQLMDLIRDAWSLAQPDVFDVARQHLGARATGKTDDAVMTEVAAECNEFRYTAYQHGRFALGSRNWVYAVTLLADSCGIARQCLRASWTPSHRGADSKRNRRAQKGAKQGVVTLTCTSVGLGSH